jgi:hypothetical protein
LFVWESSSGFEFQRISWRALLEASTHTLTVLSLLWLLKTSLVYSAANKV